MKQPARLSELVLPQMAFSINSHAGEEFWWFKNFREEERKRERKEKEEK